MQLYQEVLGLSDGARVNPAEILTMVAEIEQYELQSEGVQITSGSFIDYFPCHDTKELEFLVQNWVCNVLFTPSPSTYMLLSRLIFLCPCPSLYRPIIGFFAAETVSICKICSRFLSARAKSR